MGSVLCRCRVANRRGFLFDGPAQYESLQRPLSALRHEALDRVMPKSIVATITAMPEVLVTSVAIMVAWWASDRFMSEARGLTRTMSNAVVCVVVSSSEGTCDRELLTSELEQNHANTRLALEGTRRHPDRAPTVKRHPVRIG